MDEEEELGTYVEGGELVGALGIEANEEIDEDSSVDMHNKTYTISSKSNQESIELFSEEEFPDNTFEVGRTVIGNYFNSKETIIDYSKIPTDIFSEESKFRATPTSLNNKLVFIATNDNFCEHKPDKDSRKKFCELAPVCHIGWSRGDRITKVLILDSDNHPRNGEQVWSCRHHALASIEGVKLQTQRYDHHRPVVKVKTTEVSEQKDEVKKDVKKDEVIDAALTEDGKKNAKVNAVRKKKKKELEEEETMYDRIKKNGKKHQF